MASSLDYLLDVILYDVAALWEYTMTHTHPVPALGTSGPSLQSVAKAPQRIANAIKASTNLLNLIQNNTFSKSSYLVPNLGTKNILSRQNMVN